MADLAVWQRTIVDEEGNVVPGAEVEVRREEDGSLATLYADRAGETPLSNPLAADMSGFVRFFAQGDAYTITAVGAGSTRTWRFDPTGRLQEFDRVSEALNADGGADIVSARANLGTFSTVADVENSHIPPVLDSIRTNGYYAPGDGGGALYKRAASEPTHAGKIRSADGSWWELAEPYVNVKMFGAVGDAETDDTVAVQNALDYGDVRYSVYFPSGTYRTSAPLYVTNRMVAVVCDPACTLRSIGDGKNHPCIVIGKDAGSHHTFGVIDSYSDALVIKGNVKRVTFKTISRCGRGVVISATEEGESSLDNKIDGVQIGLCDEAIVFEQVGKRAQQGNEVRVNFVSETKHTLVFDDNGTHTERSSWDKNFVELMASDPYYQEGASLCYNKSGYAVPNLNYSIKVWAGGWNTDDDTMVVIRGPFADSCFEMCFATRITAEMLVDAAGRSAFDSCRFKVLNTPNLGAGANAAVQAIASSDPKDAFNNGQDLFRSQARVSLSVPSLNPGQTASLFIYHALATSSFSQRIFVKASSPDGYLIRAYSQGNEEPGRVRIAVTNISNQTTPAGNATAYLQCGD